MRVRITVKNGVSTLRRYGKPLSVRQAIGIRRKDGNIIVTDPVLGKANGLASDIEDAAFGNAIHHDPHPQSANGVVNKNPLPHYQTPGVKGHSFYNTPISKFVMAVPPGGYGWVEYFPLGPQAQQKPMADGITPELDPISATILLYPVAVAGGAVVETFPAAATAINDFFESFPVLRGVPVAVH
jgi:hypothetical protein